LKHPKSFIRRFLLILLSAVVAAPVLMIAVLHVTSIPLEPILSTFGVTPKIEGYTIEYDSLELEYAYGFRVKARNVEIQRTGDADPLNVSEVDAIISPFSLMRGIVYPSELRVRGIALSLERTENGLYFGSEQLFSASNSQVTQTEEVPGLLELLNRINQIDRNTSPIEILRRLSLEDVNIVFHDRVARASWSTSAVDIGFSHEESDVLGFNISTTLNRGDKLATLKFSVSHSPNAKEAPFEVVMKLPSSEILDGYLESQTSKVFQGEIELQLNSAFAGNGALGVTSFTLLAKKGALHLPELFSKNLPVHLIQADGSYDPSGTGSIVVNKIRFEDSDSIQITGAGKIEDLSGRLVAEVEVQGGTTSIESLSRYLPDVAAPGLSSWISKNIAKASLSNLKLSLKGPLAEFPFTSNQQDRALDASFSYQGLEVKFLESIQPASGLSGEFQIKNSSLSVHSDSGSLGIVRAKNVQVLIESLYSNPVLTVQTKLEGEAKGVMPILSSLLPEAEALRFSSGTQQTQVKVIYPLSSANGAKALKFEVETDLQGVAASYGENPLLVEAVAARISASENSFRLTGKGSANGEQIEFTAEDASPWLKKNFRGMVKGSLPEAHYKKVLSSKEVVITGSPNVVLSLTASESSNVKVNAQVDLKPVALEIPHLAWKKSKGEAGTAACDATWSPSSQELIVRKLVATGPKLNLNGDVRFSTSKQELTALTLSPLQIGESHLAVGYADRRWSVVGKKLVIVLDGKTSESSEATLPKEFELSVSLDELILGREVLLNAQGALSLTESKINKLNFAFKNRHQKKSSIEIVEEAQKKALVIDSQDAGGLSQLLGMPSYISKGSIHGRLTSLELGGFDPAAIEGQLVLKDVQIIDSKVILRLLSFLSIENLLSQKGQVPFSNIRIGFRRSGSTVDIVHAKAEGPVMVLYFKGLINTGQNTIKGEGEAVPFGALGTVAGQVPLLGKAVSKLQKNIAAAHYKVEGSLNDPKVSLSLLNMIPERVRKPLEFPFEYLLRGKKK
jgi:hypothetical protein